MNQQDILASLWVERYRPHSINKMALMPAYREKFEGFIRDGMIPHILLEGSAGSGKTTLSRILIESLDCEALKLNASDERGIDVIRNKVKNFAQVATFKKFKIILLDEADQLTPDAQDALKNIMETYSKVCRFILTANNVGLITEPIISRCQLFHFSSMPKPEMLGILKSILKEEKIGYEESDLTKHIEQFYPDLRRSISMMQMHISSGKFVYVDEAETVKKIFEFLMVKDLRGIRQLLASKKGMDYSDLYRRIYDNIDMFDKSIRLQVLLDAAEYLYRDAAIIDKEMNFVAFCIKIMSIIKVDKK